jgi:hypothetical protein
MKPEKIDVNEYDLTSSDGILNWINDACQYWDARYKYEAYDNNVLGGHGLSEMKGVRWAFSHIKNAIRRQLAP